MKRILFILCFTLAAAAWAQESRLGADFRGEGERLGSSCSGFSFGKLANCAEVLFTDHPMHIAAGSLAPQNGFGFGPAFVYHWTPNESWRLNWDIDAVATSNQSWRAGAYMTAVWDRHGHIVVRPGGTPAAGRSRVAVQEVPVFHVYAESTSLNKLGYFGLGPATSDTARSYFGMTEAIVGASAVWPILKRFNVSLYGEANGRFVDVRGLHGQSSPSIEQIYTPATAPGLLNQSAFAQFGQGVRLRPTFVRDYIRLNYLVNFQEYIAPGNSAFSFRRFTVDLKHQFPLYQNTGSTLPRDFNGPDDCSESPSDPMHKCPPLLPPPPPGKTRNLEGSINLQLLISESIVPGGHVVPFYFQPTLGGSDINGNPALASYQDYRFRAPNILVARASIEHSIYKWPLGVTAMIDEGKVALNRSDIDFTHLRHSYSAGLTLRAGGFPLIYILFSWGGREGMHTTARLDTSLLGGSARPSLY
jgi:hypothetical protein